MKRGFGSLNTGNSKEARPEEIVDMIKLTKDFKNLRLVGDVHGYAQHWIEIVTQKGTFSIPKVSLNYDSNTDTFDQTIEDPYDKIPNPKRTSRVYFVNAIDRDAQEDKPRRAERPDRDERRSGLKNRKSKSWTPVGVLRVTGGVAGMLKNLMQMNKHKVKGKVQECEISDPDYGCDIFISYDDKAKPNAYQVQKGDASPLTDEEKGYLLWDLTSLMKPDSLDEAKREAESLSAKSPVEEDTESDDDDGDDALTRGRDRDRGRGRDRDSKADKLGRADRSSRSGREVTRSSGRSSRDERSSRSDRSERSSSRDRSSSDRSEKRRRRGI